MRFRGADGRDVKLRQVKDDPLDAVVFRRGANGVRELADFDLRGFVSAVGFLDE